MWSNFRARKDSEIVNRKQVLTKWFGQGQPTKNRIWVLIPSWKFYTLASFPTPKWLDCWKRAGWNCLSYVLDSMHSEIPFIQSPWLKEQWHKWNVIDFTSVFHVIVTGLKVLLLVAGKWSGKEAGSVWENLEGSYLEYSIHFHVIGSLESIL